MRIDRDGVGADWLGRRLRSEADRARAAPSADLRWCILIELARRKARGTEPRRGVIWRLAWPGAIAACLALVLLGWVVLRPAAPPPRPASPPTRAAAPRPLTVIDAAVLTRALARRAGEVQAASEGVLLAEAGLVADDLKRVGTHVVANLPVPWEVLSDD